MQHSPCAAQLPSTRTLKRTAHYISDMNLSDYASKLLEDAHRRPHHAVLFNWGLAASESVFRWRRQLKSYSSKLAISLGERSTAIHKRLRSEIMSYKRGNI
jgi:hypothetical protein